MVQQNTADRDIFIASNINTTVFKIANNGDVLINGEGNYKKNNRDVILDTSNYVLSTSNNLINKANENDSNVRTYVLTTSNNLINKANENDSNVSNYVLSTSNILSNRLYILDQLTSNVVNNSISTLNVKVSANDSNVSNYVLSSSNNLINKVNENDSNVSNYVLSTSNNLINKANENDSNVSNYVLSTSNNLINKANENDSNVSNYVLSTSNLISTRISGLTTDMITENLDASKKFIVGNLYNNNLILNGTLTINSNLIVLGDKDANTTTKMSMLCNTLIAIGKLNDTNVSNYVSSTSNILSNRLYILDQLTSNVVNNSISILNVEVGANNANISNYVLNTSNLISSRITDLTTDMITQPTNATRRFIVNNSYNNNLELNGTLTINSNLIVLGDSTRLDTIVYNTERLEIVNGNNTTSALMVQQNTSSRDIFLASNMSATVFKIANNGDVLMNGTLTAANIAGAGASITALNMANASSGTLAVARGGTGSATLTAGQVLIGNTTTALLQTANLTWDVANNRLGVRTATPATSLHVVGEIVATNNITSYYSDERLKTKISDIRDPLEIINKLNGFYYIPNELARINGITNTDKEIGLSAQDVQRVLPEIVKLAPFDLATNDEGKKISKSGENYLTMSYERLAPVFVEAIKVLEQKNIVLEQKNLELTDKYNKLFEDIRIIKKKLLIES
jgi:hypothetical protein